MTNDRSGEIGCSLVILLKYRFMMFTYIMNITYHEHRMNNMNARIELLNIKYMKGAKSYRFRRRWGCRRGARVEETVTVSAKPQTKILGVRSLSQMVS